MYWRLALMWASNVRGSWAGDVDMYCTQEQQQQTHTLSPHSDHVNVHAYLSVELI